MFVFRCISLLLIVANFVRCEKEQFVSNHNINLGSTITIDASKPPVDDVTFYGEYIVKAFSVNTISVLNFTDSKFGFGILQVHSCWYNLTLSFNKTILPNLYENGTNLGFTLYPSRQKSQDIYLHNFNYFTSVNISVALIVYNKTTPEPGGCNMEYPVANAPVLTVTITYRKEYISIDTPLAAYRADETNEVKRCNVSVSYMGYHLFLKRGDYTCRSLFDGIKRLMTINRARDNGILGASVPGGVANRRRYLSIPGTGIVFQTIVSGTSGTSSYVPAFSISCSPVLWETSCNIFDTATYHVLAGALIIVGIIRGYFGHILKTISVFIDSFIFGLLTVFYTIYWSDADVSDDKVEQFLFIGALSISILFTILFVCFKLLHKSFSLIANIIVGYLLGAFIIYFIDDYFYNIKSYGWMYEIVFAGSILAVLIVLTVCQSLGPVILSATCGSFYIVQGLCYISGNHLNYVVFNALRYTSVEDFRTVHSTPAVTIEDLWFLLLWLVLCIAAVLFQLEVRKQRPNLGEINERAPLISRMTRGSDEVFESPESNIRFLKQLHSRRP